MPSLAVDVRNMMEANDATVVTDGYGLSSTLDFYGGVPPVVIGYNAQGQEAQALVRSGHAAASRSCSSTRKRCIRGPDIPKTSGRPDFVRQLERACSRVAAGPTLGYEFHDSSGHMVPARQYFTTWCTARVRTRCGSCSGIRATFSDGAGS